MSDTVITTRRWNSFVCPGCRCVFRVPQDHDGVGVVCPACRIMLRLPGPDDELPPLVAPSAIPEPVETEAEAEEYEENTESDEAVTAARSDRNFIAFLAVTGVALVGLVAWALMPEKKPPGVITDLPAPVEPPPAAGNGVTLEQPKPILLEVEAAAKAFLDAPDRAAALELVLDPAATGPRWDAWLAGESYAVPGFHGLADTPVTTGAGEGAMSTVMVRTGDYNLREISFVRRDGRLRVDWESWAGWSEMSWEEFREKKPTEPTLFRVQLSDVEYFNFAFSDDREWSSYRLDSPDGMESLYGYVPLTGDLDQRLRPIDPGAKKKWLLKLKFPADAPRDNQVVIDSIIADGWVTQQKAGE